MKQLTTEEYKKILISIRIGHLKQEIEMLQRLISIGRYSHQEVKDMEQSIHACELELAGFLLLGECDE
jgi:hypothetical protein